MALHSILTSTTPSHVNSSASYFQTPPILRLPVETLSRVFEFATYKFGDEAVDDAISNLDLGLLNFPMRVATVSKRFRAIAHSTPSLWTTLRFSYPPRHHPRNQKPSDEYVHDYTRDRLWLIRSRACPLDVILCYRDPTWNFTEERHYFRREHMERIISLLESHAWRIRRFTLICDTFAPIHASLEFLSRRGDTMCKLSILELYRCNEYVAEYPRFYPPRYAKPVALPLNHAPLKRIILAGVHIDWDQHCNRNCESLHHLDTLDISYHSRDTRPNLDVFIQTLRASPDLNKLSIIGSGPQIPPAASPNVGPNVSQLVSEGFIASDYLGCILPNSLASLSFHRLSVLKLGFYHINDAILIISLIFNMSSSGAHPPITDLTLKDLSQPLEMNSSLSASNLLTFLATLCDRRNSDHTVRKLGITSHSIGKLSALNREGVVLPFTALRHLSLECIKATEKAFMGLFNVSPALETLTLDGVSSCVLLALCPLPIVGSDNYPDKANTSSYPCANLKTISLRFLDFPKERITSYTALGKYRAAAGVPLEFLKVDSRDVNLGHREMDVMTARKYVTEGVEIFGINNEEELFDGYEEEDPYAPGGAFNDPEFDALFSGEN